MHYYYFEEEEQVMLSCLFLDCNATIASLDRAPFALGESPLFLTTTDCLFPSCYPKDNDGVFRYDINEYIQTKLFLS